MKYENFKGRAKEDGEAWIDSFKGATASNGEDAKVDLCGLVQGLLKKDARCWYKGLSIETKRDCKLIEAAFLLR